MLVEMITSLIWLPYHVLQCVFVFFQLIWYWIRFLLGYVPPTVPREPVQENHFKVIVVGAGFSGLGIAIKLKEAQIPFVIIDKAKEVGGTWWYNTYPGCACDIPSHLYSYSFEPNPSWTRTYPPQEEILAYLKGIADKYELRKYIRFENEVKMDRWNEDTNLWEITLTNGEILRANIVINAAGALHLPNYPNIQGREKFSGPSWHSSDWDHSVDYTNKRVAMIGSAASAVQAIPVMSPETQHMYVFQRTANWVLPKDDLPISPWVRNFYQRFPGVLKYVRWIYYIKQELSLWLVFTPERWTSKIIRYLGKRYIRKSLHKNPELAEKMIPSYPMGCKRILLSNTYFKAIRNPEKVTIVTDGIQEIEKDGVRTKNGDLIKVDAIVYATGFRVLDGLPKTYGRGNYDLLEDWLTNSPTSYLGMTVPKFPNKFILLGPHTGLGHNSVVWMIECQVNYVIQAITHMINQKKKTIEVREDVHDNFLNRVRKELGQMVWSSSNCKSWYQTKGGSVFALWPSYTFVYWWRTLEFDSNDYIFS